MMPSPRPCRAGATRLAATLAVALCVAGAPCAVSAAAGATTGGATTVGATTAGATTGGPTKSVLSPEDFAYGSEVVVSQPAAAYRVPLPLAVYQHSVRGDLGDLRVFNALAEPAPYGLQRPPPVTAAAGPVELPLFALPSGSHAVIDGIHLSINTNGSAVQWQARSAQEAAAVPGAQYILDGRSLSVPISALTLHWAQSDVGYSGRLRIEVSDDLGAWRTVVAAAPVVNLRANGQSIVQNRIELPPTQSRFWRLSWVGAAPLMKLDSLSAEPTQSVAGATREALDVPGTRDPKHPNEYLFDLGAQLPVERVGLSLSEANTLIDAELAARSVTTGPWRPALHAAFSRLNTADGDQQTAPLVIAIERSRYWRARLSSTDVQSAQPLWLHVEWVPDDVIFLARGHGPFLLAYGSGVVVGAPIDLAQLPAGLAIETAALGDSRVLGGVSRLQPTATALQRRQLLLWTVLLLAVCALAWMAYRLLTETPAAQSGKP
jgi:hypothetical protein